jgi:hypothetical protein
MWILLVYMDMKMCHVLMKSTLQTEIAQVVYVALGTSCKELFPIMDKVSALVMH